MLYYCRKPNCQGHHLFSEKCAQVATVQVKFTSGVSRYKPSRQFHDQFDIPETKPATNGAKPALAVTA